MLVPKEIYDNIDDIIERSYNGFIYNLIGDEFLTEEQRLMMESLGLLTRRKTLLELLYLLVKQRSEKRYQTRRELKELLEGVFETGIFDQLPRTHQMTIDNAHQAMNSIVEQAKAEVKKQVKREVVNINKEFTQDAEMPQVPTDFLEPLPESEKDKGISKLLLAVGAGLLIAHKLFKREFTGELTDLVNKAVSDAATEKSTGRDTLVYKLVVNDTHLCNYCHGAYVNADGSPIIYKLRELQANGSNIGLPRGSWKPVVGPHHPNCRCQLLIKDSDKK